MVLLGEKVSGNIYMTGNGHIGGEKVLFEKGCISQRKSTEKVKHFTAMGLTNLLV